MLADDLVGRRFLFSLFADDLVGRRDIFVG